MDEGKKDILKNWVVVITILLLLNIVIGMVCYVVVEAEEIPDYVETEEEFEEIEDEREAEIEEGEEPLEAPLQDNGLNPGNLTDDGRSENEKEALGVAAPEVYISGVNDGSLCKDSCTISITAKNISDGFNLRFKCEILRENGERHVLEDSSIRAFGNNYEDSRTYSEEGIYEVMVYAFDDSGNASDIKYISFGLDTNAPEVSFEGFDFTKVQNSASNLIVCIKDVFYEGMVADVKFYKVSGNDRILLKAGEYDVRAVNNKNIYSFEGSGSFIGQVIVYDKAQHETKKEIQFQIDMIPPYIEIDFDGEDYGGEAFLDKVPDVNVRIEEDNYSDSVVNIKLKKKGDSYVYELFPNLTGSVTDIPVEIKEDGIYELSVTATDASGNVRTENINFTIDSNGPKIGYLSDFNEKYLKSFTLPNDFSKYIDDVTGVNYKAYLNSEETGSGEIKKDGKYILQVVAWDEAGNVSEEMIAFIVDNTKPTVMVSGIGDNGKMDKGTPITLSLKDSEDYFTDICVNGENLNLSSDRRTAQLIPSEYGSYNIVVKAKDNAGNITTETIKANCEAILAAPDSFSTKNLEVKTISKTRLFSPNPVLLWAMCGVICAFAVMLVVVAFSVEMNDY